MEELQKIKELAVKLKKSIYDRYGVTEQQMINIQLDKINEMVNILNLMIEWIEIYNAHFVYDSETESLELVNVKIVEGSGS